MKAKKQPDESEFRWRHTRAAVTLGQALRRAAIEKGLSLRKLAGRLGYKQATVLSHMATGRVPIPLERAPAIATAVGLDPAQFLISALEQRAPEAADLLSPLFARGPKAEFCAELEVIAGSALDDLPAEHKEVILEVVTDRAPRRRWLTLAELPTVMEVRAARPDFVHRGLPKVEIEAVAGLLAEFRGS
jgi:transcriptional regulator with XRE-family HTH domain